MQQRPRNKKVYFEQTQHADVDYLDDKGEFDFKKFAMAAGEKVSEEHRERMLKIMLEK